MLTVQHAELQSHGLFPHTYMPLPGVPLQLTPHKVCATYSQTAVFWDASYVEREALDTFGHNFTDSESAARMQLRKLPQVHMGIMIAEIAIVTMQYVSISGHEDNA